MMVNCRAINHLNKCYNSVRISLFLNHKIQICSGPKIICSQVSKRNKRRQYAHLSQSTVPRLIKPLENYLGHSLFTRKTRGMQTATKGSNGPTFCDLLFSWLHYSAFPNFVKGARRLLKPISYFHLIISPSVCIICITRRSVSL